MLASLFTLLDKLEGKKKTTSFDLCARATYLTNRPHSSMVNTLMHHSSGQMSAREFAWLLYNQELYNREFLWLLYKWSQHSHAP